MKHILYILLLLTAGGTAACSTLSAGGRPPFSCSCEELPAVLSPEMRDPQSLEAARLESGIPLSFWAGPGAAADPTITVNPNHPCGSTVMCCVDVIPDPDTQDIADPDWVFEFSESGEILERWWIPINKTVQSVHGSDLIVSYMNPTSEQVGAALAVGPDGSFRVVPWVGFRAIEQCQCSDLGVYSESAYLRCWRYRDGVTGSVRIFAYQGPCT